MSTAQRNQSIIVVIALLAGWWIGAASSRPRSPLDDRPVLSWMARAAKNLLWIAVFVEPPPPAQPQQVRTEIGADGYVKVDHGRGW